MVSYLTCTVTYDKNSALLFASVLQVIVFMWIYSRLTKNTHSSPFLANKPQARVTQTPSLTEIYIGEPVSFSCMVDKSSGWEYMWYRDGIEFNTSSTYTITSPKPYDSGQYWCRAKRGRDPFYTEKSETKVLQLSGKHNVFLTQPWRYYL